MLDPDGFVVSWNAGAQRIKGYRPTEIIGQHFSRFFTPEDQAAGLPAKALREARRKGRFEAEGLAGPQGRQPLLGERHRRADPRRARDADRLRQGHPRHHRAAWRPRRRCARASAASGCWSKASSTTPSTCSIRAASSPTGTPARSGSRATAPDEIIGQHFSRFYTPEDRAAGLPARALETAAARGPLRGRRLARAQGRQPLLGLRASSTPSATRAASCSASPRSPATSPSAARPRRRCARASGSSACWCAASPTTRSTCSTRTASSRTGTPARERIKGYAADEIIGQHFSRFYTERGPRGRRAGARARTSPPRKGASRPKAGACARTAACSGRASSSTPIRDEDGSLVGFAKITRDITERREAQLALQEAQAQLRPDAEDGGARPAHRRRRARLQQPADDRQRPRPARCKKLVADDPKRRARRRGDRGSRRGAAKR